ncbi:hypothetical protein [Streptomyces sp. NPDC059575]|uniref:hypothetical protein n=1 Tax=Streptomyces sp. NPDC059575 TaxID=3346872 RepID=UPI00369BFD05
MDVSERPESEADGEAGPRPGGRTGRLLGCAVVLGLVAGTCAGYLVQAGRAPDKLPPLSQPTLAQSRGKAAEPLSAARDHKVKVNGDLRRLLLRKPAGASDDVTAMGDDGWTSLWDYSKGYAKPQVMFHGLIRDQFRRAAVTGWLQGERSVVIRLVQFRQEHDKSAADTAEEADHWAATLDGTRSRPVPGTGDGMAYVHDGPVGHWAEAHAWRGDIAMEIWIYDTKPVPPTVIGDLAERQMERL